MWHLNIRGSTRHCDKRQRIVFAKLVTICGYVPILIVVAGQIYDQKFSSVVIFTIIVFVHIFILDWPRFVECNIECPADYLYVYSVQNYNRERATNTLQPKTVGTRFGHHL